MTIQRKPHNKPRRVKAKQVKRVRCRMQVRCCPRSEQSRPRGALGFDFAERGE